MTRAPRAAVAAIAIAGAGLAGTASAQAAAGAVTPRWHIVGTTSGYLNTLVAPGPSTQWAFGVHTSTLNKPTAPVVLRHVGTRWIQAAVPAAPKGAVVCAGASSPANIWAFEGMMFGPYGANNTAALQLRAGRWVLRHRFGTGLFVTGCNVLSATNVWVFGSTGSGPAVGTWHLHGTAWTHMTSYPARYLGQASVISARNIWATGWDGLEGVLAHWNGSAWKTDRSLLKALPKQTSTVHVQVRAVTAISSASLWVEAIVSAQGKEQPVVRHWNGTRWSRVGPSAFGYYLPDAVPDGHGGWWSTGYAGEGILFPSMRYVLHGTHGHWTKIALPAARSGHVLDVQAVVSVPGTRIAYAVADEVSKTTGYGTGVMLRVRY